MRVKCTRDGHVFTATIHPRPTKIECKDGDQVINCPKCGRGYFLQDDGTWVSDRKLEILEE